MSEIFEVGDIVQWDNKFVPKSWGYATVVKVVKDTISFRYPIYDYGPNPDNHHSTSPRHLKIIKKAYKEIPYDPNQLEEDGDL